MKYLAKVRNILVALVITAIALGAFVIAPIVIPVLIFLGIGVLLFIFLYASMENADKKDE